MENILEIDILKMIKIIQHNEPKDGLLTCIRCSCSVYYEIKKEPHTLCYNCNFCGASYCFEQELLTLVCIDYFSASISSSFNLESYYNGYNSVAHISYTYNQKHLDFIKYINVNLNSYESANNFHLNEVKRIFDNLIFY